MWRDSGARALLAGAFALSALLWGASDGAAARAAYCAPEVFQAPAPRPFGFSRRRLRCEVYRVRVPRGELALATAVDEAQRERGLMFVTALSPRTGMIFAFPDGDRQREFWMKNTLVPLDMVFVAGDGMVTGVAQNVPATTRETPDEEVPRRSGYASFVIELNAGEAREDGIKAGGWLRLARLESN